MHYSGEGQSMGLSTSAEFLYIEDGHTYYKIIGKLNNVENKTGYDIYSILHLDNGISAVGVTKTGEDYRHNGYFPELSRGYEGSIVAGGKPYIEWKVDVSAGVNSFTYSLTAGGTGFQEETVTGHVDVVRASVTAKKISSGDSESDRYFYQVDVKLSSQDSTVSLGTLNGEIGISEEEAFDGISGKSCSWVFQDQKVPYIFRIIVTVPKSADTLSFTVKLDRTDGTPFYKQKTFNFSIVNDNLPDSDGDGLPDAWETGPVDLDGDGKTDIDLRQMGADPNKKDIFVECDWMVRPAGKIDVIPEILSVDRPYPTNFQPDEESMHMVYQAFQDHDINLHVDAGPFSTDFVTGKIWGSLSGGNEIPHQKIFDLGKDPETGDDMNWNDVINRYFSKNRAKIFHYCIFADHFCYGDSSTTISGISSGQLSIVAEGVFVDAFAEDISDLDHLATVKRKTAATFMHELGHTLGLTHGGIISDELTDEETNCKPNYLSIMNYAFQLTGLVGTDKIDYSEYKLPDLNEAALNEKSGIDPNGLYKKEPDIGTKIVTKADKKGNPIKARVIKDFSKGVDFDGWWGIQDKKVSVDINGDGQKTILMGASDWDHLQFQSGSIGTVIHGGASDGAGTFGGDDFVVKIPENTDAQELTIEEAIEMGVAGNIGEGVLDSPGPYLLAAGDNKQKVHIKVRNLGPEQADFRVKVDKSAINDALDRTVSVDGTNGQLGETDLAVPVVHAEKTGSYTIHASLYYQDTKLQDLNIPVRIYSFFKDQIEALKQLEDSGDQLDDAVKEEYLDLYERQKTPDKPNQNSNTNQNSAPKPSASHPTEETAAMYRLYNPNSGEHFYTANAGERDFLAGVGWNYEGIGWIAPAHSNTPVYRLYNPNAGDHHYTMSAGERDNLVKVGWNYEGIGWYSDDAQRTPLYREYNPKAKSGSHNYTTQKAENDFLVAAGWNYEGIGWYGV